MGEMMKEKAVGFYFVILAAFVGIVSLVRLLLWAPNHDTMDIFMVVALIAAILIDAYLVFRENDWLMIMAVIGYAIAVFRLLTLSVGSFVDALQGIKMFGDATQVGTIISISVCILASAVLSVIASFLKLNK